MKLALFDLDDTLIEGDCASLWGQYMQRLGWVTDPQFLLTEQTLMQQYAEGVLLMDDYMRFTLVPLIGRKPEDVAESVAHFIDDMIRPAIRPAAEQRVREHRERGDRLIVVSASGRHLVEPISRCFGIEETLSIDLAVKEGRYTGLTQGTMTFREGKVTRLGQLLGDEKDRLLDSASFYSDSANDLPLLQRVGFPYVVNPDPVLLQHAQRAGWPVLNW
ncbi:HAD family hydrolase [Pectobacterium sp. B1J-3]|uniref:HAD family hydrolase n=1 Tax=Pectobacterium sp. B1J-3 TaxID=3385371 RepID=UPI003905BC0C